MTQEPMARSSFTMSRTINLQNFNSIRYEIGIEIPCPHTDEGLKAGHTRAVNFVVEKMVSEVSSTGAVPKVLAASGQTLPENA